MIRNLLLFTETYPRGGITEEAFVVPELAHLAKAFDRVYLIPTYVWGDVMDTWRVSENIRLDRTYSDLDITRIGKLDVLAYPSAWPYCLCNRTEARRRIEYSRFIRWLRGFCKEEKLDEGDLWCYTFWLTPTAEYLGRYAQTSSIRVLARAHRYDILELPETSFRRKALQGLSAVFPDSQEGVFEVLRRHPALEGRVEVSYMGITKPDPLKRNLRSTDDTTLTFFSCHTLIPRKRGLLCARMLTRLAETMPKKTIRWILVGDGEECEGIRAVAAGAPTNFVLDMRGALPNAEVHDIYANEPIDMAVLISTSEGLAVMDQEALSYGIPVIGADAGGTRECISDETGALLPITFSFDQFRDAVLNVLAHLDARRQAAFDLYRKMFDASITRRIFVERIRAMEGQEHSSIRRIVESKKPSNAQTVISVVMPVHNAADYLCACLDSVLAQTYRNFEVIVVDDGSTDGSSGILADYAVRDSRLRVFRREHTNAGAARNFGMAQTVGSYLLFLDADDVFAPWMFETLLMGCEELGADIAACDATWFVSEEGMPQIVRPAKITWDDRTLCAGCAGNPFLVLSMMPWNKLFSRTFVVAQGLRFQEQSSTNDFLFSALAIRRARKIVHTTEHLVLYRLHAASIQANKSKTPENFLRAVSAYCDRVGWEAGAEDPHARRLFAALYAVCCVRELRGQSTFGGYRRLYRAVRANARRMAVSDLPSDGVAFELTEYARLVSDGWWAALQFFAYALVAGVFGKRNGRLSRYFGYVANRTVYRFFEGKWRRCA